MVNREEPERLNGIPLQFDILHISLNSNLLYNITNLHVYSIEICDVWIGGELLIYENYVQNNICNFISCHDSAVSEFLQ